MPESTDTPNDIFLKPEDMADLDKQMLVKAHLEPDGRQPTMSSREIAELCDKRHDHVMRDIRTMLLELHGEPNLPKFGGIYQAANGGSRPCFTLPKRESLILVSDYNLAMRAAIIDRWQELEAQQQASAPILALNDPSTLRALLLDNVEERMKLAQELAAAAPKLEAFDRIASAEGSLCITDAAKSLQVRPKSLFDFLRAHGWIYQPHGGRGDIAYAPKLQQGLMEHKTTTVHRSDGSEKIITQARITPKGLTRLAQEFTPPVKLAA
ncbi:phage regulatory protein/antirepressor Ant [Sphingomonas faeni]|uniref:phage regulatory protein/antirepressor Ant n=1 Tax=Sphingomonas faeni TaxID=185950 RepID=UPI002786DEF8|nr:phage regulatory protein/antirepressor Ant [Sphingomonas faeni]MDQ0836969.1 phage antirepressor YoqD-like protein [Sphingomonas faeni]